MPTNAIITAVESRTSSPIRIKRGENRQSNILGIYPLGEGAGYTQRLCDYINKNYKRNITIDELSRVVSLNKNYMIRIFKERMGKTPIEYLIETRLFYSSNLLTSSKLSVGDIALECGFNSSAYFTKVFKEHYNITPLEFRKKYQKM